MKYFINLLDSKKTILLIICQRLKFQLCKYIPLKKKKKKKKKKNIQCYYCIIYRKIQQKFSENTEDISK